jgi:hypothetical protein
MLKADLVQNVFINYRAASRACEMSQQGQQAPGLLAAIQQADLVQRVIYFYTAAISACEKSRQ